jgi:hypothetical protein
MDVLSGGEEILEEGYKKYDSSILLLVTFGTEGMYDFAPRI